MVVLLLMMTAICLNTLDLIAVLHPQLFHQEESFLTQAFQPTVVVILFMGAMALDLCLGRIAKTSVRE
jgi:hypothetical protein